MENRCTKCGYAQDFEFNDEKMKQIFPECVKNINGQEVVFCPSCHEIIE